MTCLFGGFAIALFAFAGVGSVPGASKKEASSVPQIETPVRNKYADDYGGTELKGTDGINLSLKTSTKTSISQRYDFSVSMSDSSSNQYILGYYGEGDLYLPLTFYYTVTKADGTTVEEHTVQSKKSANALYDGIGSEIGNDVSGMTIFSSSVSILLDSADDEVDPSSIYATNIYKAKQDSDSKLWVPDTSEKYYLSLSRARFKSTTRFGDIMQISLKEISTFEDKIAFRCDYTMDGAEETLKNSMDEADYAAYSKDVANGIDGIRYRFQSFNTAYYEVRFNDGTSVKFPVEYETGNGQSWINLNAKGGELVFMTDRTSSYYNGKLNLDNISGLYLDNVSLRLEFYVLETGKSASSRNATRTYAFGMVETNPNRTPVRKTSYVLVTWLAALVTALVFAGLATGLYFYRKNRYKNDEFLRVDTKQFLKQAGIFLIVTESLVLEIASIVIRFGNFNNSTVVQNPVDKYVIIFALASILSIGYLIKWSISAFKIRSERRKTEKLHLNDLANDDGTVNLNELEKREEEKSEKSAEKAA